MWVAYKSTLFSSLSLKRLSADYKVSWPNPASCLSPTQPVGSNKVYQMQRISL